MANIQLLSFTAKTMPVGADIFYMGDSSNSFDEVKVTLTNIWAQTTALANLVTVGTIGTGIWEGTVVGATYGGTGINNGSSTITLGGSLTLSGAHATTITVTGATTVTLPTSGTLITTTVTTLSDLTSIGTIGTGVWQGTLIGATYGGTGVNNGSNTLTLAGDVTFSGANTVDITTTGNTTITLPTSGTLVSSTVTTLSDLVSVGTITTGTWQAGVVGSTYGGTGVNNGSSTITLGGSLTLSGAFTTTITVTANTTVTLPTSGTLVNTAVATLSSLTTVGTIGTGTWQGTVISPTYGGTGLSNPTAHGIMVSEGASDVNPIVLTAGQILIGTTSGDPSATTLTQGTGITITSASGSITIASSASGGIVWNNVTGTTQSAAVNNAYVTSSSSATTVTLPATAAIGTIFAVQGAGAGGWTLNYGSGQNIQMGNLSTTTTSGSLASTNQFDSVALVTIVANTTFAVTSAVGNLTVT
jgi:hypothetical protein